MLNRDDTRCSPILAFSELEMKVLRHYFRERNKPKSLQQYIIRLARLGGYLYRSNDRPPGYTVIRKGLRRLAELSAGFELALLVGN